MIHLDFSVENPFFIHPINMIYCVYQAPSANIWIAVFMGATSWLASLMMIGTRRGPLVQSRVAQSVKGRVSGHS